MLIFGKEINLNTIYSLDIGTETITRGGITKIQGDLGLTLPPDFDKLWMGKGGAFSKRLGKLLKKQKIEIDEQKFSAFCAELKNRYFTKPKTWRFDITNEFTWRAGKFKDGGSCYWNSPPSSGYRGSLKNMGGLAFRLYEDQEGLKGLGRSWLIPNLIDANNNIRSLIAYNAYGPELRPQMEILSSFLSVNVVEKNIYMGDGPYNDGLYINNGGHCLILGEEKDLKNLPHKINVAQFLYRKNFKYLCNHCYAGCQEFEAIYEGIGYCKRCSDKFTKCPECNRLISKSHFVNLRDSETKERTRTICRECNDVRKTKKISQKEKGMEETDE